MEIFKNKIVDKAVRIGGSALALVGAMEAIHPVIANASSTLGITRSVEGFVPKSEYSLVDLRNAEVAEDPTKNVEINAEVPYTWFHPMSGEQVWSYGVVLRDPNLDGIGNISLSDQGNVGELFLNGASNVGLDIITNEQNLADYRGDGARAAVWLTTGSGDILVLMDKDNNPLTQVQADDKGFAGLFLSDYNAQFGVRVIRRNGGIQPIKATFGNISQTDYADPNKRNNPSVIDVANYVNRAVAVQTAVVVPPSADQVPAFLPAETVYSFQEAPVNTYFLAKSSNGAGWSHFMQFNIPERKNGITIRDNGNVGEFFMQNRGLLIGSANNMDIILRTNPLYANDLTENNVQNRPGMWVKTQPGALIQAVDVNNGRVAASVTADGAGFGGVVMPDSFSATFKIRIVLSRPEIDTDTQIQFGAEKPDARGKASTLDLNQIIPRP